MIITLLLSQDLSSGSSWGPIVGAVVTLGLVVKALHEIYKNGWTPFKDKWVTPRAAQRRKVDHVFGVCEDLVASIQNIERELKPNGGTSLKDVVNKISRQVTHIEGWQRYQDEASGNASFKLDPEGHLIYASAAFCDLLNEDEKDLKYFGWISKARAGEKALLLRDMKEAIENKMPIDTTVTFNVGSSQNSIELRLKAIPSVLVDGELTGYFGRAFLQS